MADPEKMKGGFTDGASRIPHTEASEALQAIMFFRTDHHAGFLCINTNCAGEPSYSIGGSCELSEVRTPRKQDTTSRFQTTYHDDDVLTYSPELLSPRYPVINYDYDFKKFNP